MEKILFYETGKKQGNKKRVVYEGERFQFSCILLRFGNTLGLTTSGAPSSGECTRKEGTSATNIKDLINFLKQKKMRNKSMHNRNCEVPTDVKWMVKGVMLARPTFAA
jgi:hypothetical protein